MEVLEQGRISFQGQESPGSRLPRAQFISLAEILRVSSARSGFCLKGKDKECNELLLGMEVYFASHLSINEIRFLYLC